MEWLTDPDTWLALVTLTALEIVLGIDNIVFLSILTDRLPAEQRPLARRLGLALAALTRIGLLLVINVLASLTEPWFTVWGHALSGRDLILIGGGLFLLAKATLEIHHGIEGGHQSGRTRATTTFATVLVQVALLDIVFSLDSVITAIGMANSIWVMTTAILLSIAVMIRFAGPIAVFIERHPTFKMLALSFLMLIGVALVGEGLEMHIPKGYIYFSMGFALAVEVLNLRVRAKPPNAGATPAE